MDWEDLSDQQKIAVKEWFDSKQLKLSNRLLGYRIKQKLSREQAASLLNISLSDYVLLESGNPEVSEQSYQNYIDIIKADKMFFGSTSTKMYSLSLLDENPKNLIAENIATISNGTVKNQRPVRAKHNRFRLEILNKYVTDFDNQSGSTANIVLLKKRNHKGPSLAFNY